jgi:Type II intron maturase
LKSNLQLSLNEEKSQILNSFSNKIPFLGMLLYNISNKKIPYCKSFEIENKKRKRVRVLSRINALKNRQTKSFKDECLASLRKSYNEYRNNRAIVKKDFVSLVESSIIFKDLLNKPNRFLYREFLKDLQKITEVKENSKLTNFLKLWEQEIDNPKNNSYRPLTKKETIRRIVKILKKQHDLPAYEREWSEMFKGSNKERGKGWKPVWPDNFSLSKNAISKIRYPANGTYNVRSNAENIRIAIEDLIFQVKNSPEDSDSIFINNKNAESVWQTCENQGIFFGLPIQIKADTNEIYNRLLNNAIINKKKKPISKTSLLRSEDWSIITYYRSVAHGLLSYFRCVDNFNTVKKIIVYHIRYSLLRTLSHKQKCPNKKILDFYSKEIKTIGRYNKEISFISLAEVSNMKKKFLTKNVNDPYIAMSTKTIESSLKINQKKFQDSER